MSTAPRRLGALALGLLFLGLLAALVLTLSAPGDTEPELSFHRVDPQHPSKAEQVRIRATPASPDAPPEVEPGIEAWQHRAVALQSLGYHRCGIRPPTFRCMGRRCAARDTTPLNLFQALKDRVGYAPRTHARFMVSKALGVAELDPCYRSLLHDPPGVQARVINDIPGSQLCLVLLPDDVEAGEGIGLTAELEAEISPLCGP